MRTFRSSKYVIKIFLIISSFVAIDCLNTDSYIDIPFKKLKTSAERIREHGYPAESHYFETSDGYILNIFRIPFSPKLNNENSKKPIVFIQHGLFSCSDCFLLNGPNDAIAFNFADAGFDVWLGNARGNVYSRNNSKISINHPYFWAFSWHEIGFIDIPQTIDYILNTTAEDSLHYVGHSQGTTVFFVMTSLHPEYNAKIKTAHMLAPPIFMGNTTNGLVTTLAPFVGEPGLGSALLGTQQFMPSNPYVQRALDTLCGGSPQYPKYCETLYLLWAGNDQGNINTTLLPLITETHPAGISTNQGIHYIQLYLSNAFRAYDHGQKKNIKIYGKATPPDYPLEQITANMYLYYGLADTSANAKDIQRLPQYLPNIKLLHEIPDATWGHLDFIFANQVKKVINDPIIRYCKNYEYENNSTEEQTFK